MNIWSFRKKVTSNETKYINTRERYTCRNFVPLVFSLKLNFSLMTLNSWACKVSDTLIVCPSRHTTLERRCMDVATTSEP